VKIDEIRSADKIDFVEGKITKTSKIVKINGQNVSHAYLCDETGSIKISFWGDHADEFKEGDCIEIKNGMERNVRGERNITIFDNYSTVKKIQKEITCKEQILNESKFRKIFSIDKDTNPLFVKGKISEKTAVGEVHSRKGKQFRALAKLCDETGTIGITLWDNDAKNICDGDCIIIENGYSNVFNNKLNISSGLYGTLRKISEKINCTNVKTDEAIKLSKIKDLNYNEKNVNVEGKLKTGQLIESGDGDPRLLGYLCDETGTIGITLWRENTRFSNGDCIRIENGMVSTPGEPMLTEGFFGSVSKIDKNFDCEHKQDSSIDEEVEKI
tara:strand:- start:4775 stop:5758 length:984 start_codon:yes stop_codon:yes gene_type:complete